MKNKFLTDEARELIKNITGGAFQEKNLADVIDYSKYKKKEAEKVKDPTAFYQRRIMKDTVEQGKGAGNPPDIASLMKQKDS